MAHKGTSTFIMQRASAAVMIPLGVWFLVSVVAQLGASYETARAWVAQPLNGVLIALFIAIGAFHMRIGMSEIIADYIHGGLKTVLSLLNWLISIGVVAGAAWSVYTISLAG